MIVISTMNATSFMYGPIGLLIPIVDRILNSELLWALLLLPLAYYFGICPRTKSFDSNIPKTLKCRIKISATEKDGSPGGLIVGKWFIGYIDSVKEEKGTIWIISLKSTFESLVQEETGDDDTKYDDLFPKRNIIVEKEKFYIIQIIGHYTFRKLEFIKSNPIDAIANPIQRRILDSILILQKKTQVVMITGNPGTGKSFIADLLIKDLLTSPSHSFKKCEEVRYIYSFNPTTPNTFFSTVWKKCDPSERRRLIVLIDEVDVLLDKIHRGSLVLNQKYPMQVSDKTSWNRFLDDFDRGYYPWTTLIMTSNKTRVQLNTQDSSFLRDGRVDIWTNI